MPSIPMKERLGLVDGKPLERDFPQPARLALAYVLDSLHEKGMLRARDVVAEVLRTGRQSPVVFSSNHLLLPVLVPLLEQMQWDQVFTLCERVYEQHLIEAGYMYDEDDWIVTSTKDEARAYFSAELNQILAEDNIAYSFVDGFFQKRGRAQTQLAIERVGKVLVQVRLQQARRYFGQAQKFFNQRPEADSPNCVKEALLALEAGVQATTGKEAGRDFTKALKQLQGNAPGQVPPAIAEGMIRLHGYRGSGEGVTHAAPDGSRVGELEAELVLSLVAAYVTYLADLFSEKEEELPF